MQKLRRWFLHHWFGAVFVLLGGIWLATTVAYALGAKGISFANRYGPPATIDFGRKYDFPVVGLADGVGLELDAGGPALHGSIVKLETGLPVLCRICGYHDTAGGVGLVDYRQGDWFFRAPRDESRSREAHEGRPESRDFILTIAYNRTTGERVRVDADATFAEQEQLLAQRGLVVGEGARLTPAALGDLPTVSMQREGCVIVQLAFVAVAVLWLVLGGLAALLIWAIRRRRPPAAAA
jgi:hypothetical protein